MNGWHWYAIVEDNEVLSEEAGDEVVDALERARVFYIRKSSNIARVGVDTTTGDFLLGIFRVKALESSGKLRASFSRIMRQDEGPEAKKNGKAYFHAFRIGLISDNGDQRHVVFDPSTLKCKIQKHR